MTCPKWFVQTEDGTLHGYVSLEILIFDLALRPSEIVRILELEPGVVIRYRPVAVDHVRDQVGAM